MISWVHRLISSEARQKYFHDTIVENYRDVATRIGYLWGILYTPNPHVTIYGTRFSVYDPQLYHLLDKVEESYASLGYRIIPLSDWIDHAGWGVNIDHLWLVKREENERPIFTKDSINGRLKTGW